MTTIPLADIIIGPRFREDYGDIDALANSINTYGLLQPLLVDENNVLIDGGRRYAACTKLGLAEVPVYRKGRVPVWLTRAMELEANVRRKDMSWQERCIAIAETHEIHKRTATLTNTEWGMIETGELLGLSNAAVCYAVTIADAIRAKDKDVLAASNMTEAYRLLVERRTAAASALIVQRTSTVPVRVTTPATAAAPIIVREATDVVPPVDIPKTALTVELYNKDALVLMQELATAGRKVDHIYTDPPYAIDMDYIQQDGVGMNIDSVRATHDVADNVDLLQAFCKALPTVLADTGYCVIWCDQMMHRSLHNWLTLSGLRVQRWPLTWVKTSPCQNGAAYVNFTKTTEIAIVAAMPKASLYLTCNQCHWIGDADKLEHSPSNPFWKPLSLHEWVIYHIAAPGAVICDPFAGSGSIPVAALRCGRSVLANELDPLHYNDLYQRLNK